MDAPTVFQHYACQVVSVEILRGQKDSVLGELIYESAADQIATDCVNEGMNLITEPKLVACVGRESVNAQLWRWLAASEYWPPHCVMLVFCADVEVP